MSTNVEILQFIADALGDASYLVISGDSAAVIDPQRDVRPFRQAAAERGATIRHVFETHVHNDYLSGGRELAALGAQVVAPAGSKLEFPHLPLGDGDELRVDAATLRAVTAPGHTYEHTAYTATDERGTVTGAFTGGALLMGAAGRSDLLGPDHAVELTRLQWETAHRLARLLPASTEILPTHGAGSFCSTTGSSLERRGPLSVELNRNPALTTGTAEAFRAIQLGSAAPIPGYYRYMAPINRAGPAVYGEPPRPPLLSPAEIASALQDAVHVIDLRSRADFAAAHVPGSVEIAEGGSFLAYTGWLLPFNAPIALIAHDQAQAERVTVDLFRIGFEQVRGYLPWHDWKESGRPIQATALATVDEAREILRGGAMPVIDVRFGYEQDQLPLPGAARLPVDDLRGWLQNAPIRPLVVCASGERATMAASFLQREGLDAVALSVGGAADLA